MAKQLINTGPVAKDSLKAGATKVNANFNELYDNLGNGTSLQFAVAIASTPSAGQTLQYNATSGKFVPATVSGGTTSNSFASIAVSGQTSVVADSSTDTLTLVAGTNVTITTNDTTDTITINAAGNLDSLTDVVITTPSTNQVLKYNGTNWINDTGAAGNLDSLTDVVITTPSTNQVLKYNGTNWINDTGISWSITAADSNNYTFSGPGIVSGNTTDPVLYLYKGFTYTFVNTTGGTHPFAIRTASVANGGVAYTSGVSGSQTGTQTFEVPMNAPSTLYYQCTIHSGMGNTINIM